MALDKEGMQSILDKLYPGMAATLEEEKREAHEQDRFKRPWSAKFALGAGGVYNRDGDIVLITHDKDIADLVVDSVNSRNDTTWKDPQHRYHFLATVDESLFCPSCGGTQVFTGRGESNTPLGHDMIYGEFRCTSCTAGTGKVSGFRYNPMGEMSLIYHVWDGEKFLRVEVEGESNE